MMDYGSRAVSQVLRNLYEPRRLGSLPLSKVQAVSQILNSSNSLDTVEHRGLALAMLVEQILNSKLRTSDPELIDWHILYHHAIKGEPFKVMAEEMKLSMRSMARYYIRACSTLGRVLMEQEAATRKNELYSALE